MILRSLWLGALLLFLGVPELRAETYDTNLFSRIGLPEKGRMYHGAFTSRPNSPNENDFRGDDIRSYEKFVGKKVAWVCFSHDWFKTRFFPVTMCRIVRNTGAVPYLRLMMRSTDEPDQKDYRYTLQAILDGKYDAYLRLWAIKAREFTTPIILEWGTEANDKSRPWNGKWHGNDRKGKSMTTSFDNVLAPDGPEEYVAAYRHIVKLMRESGANNITWVFHIAAVDNPYTPENAFEVYYPGDDYVDWIGVSIYGSRNPEETEPTPLADLLNECYPRIQKMTPSKPIILSELGCTVGDLLPNEKWTEKAFEDLFGRKWPAIMGFTWWNMKWKMRYFTEETNMRVQDKNNVPQLFAIQNAFKKWNSTLQERPAIDPKDP